MGRYIPFTYSAPVRRVPASFATRDPDAGAQLASALQAMGYSPGDTIINHPYDPKNPPAPLDTSLYDAEDIFFLPTRPPKSDRLVGSRKRSYASNTDLENLIFANVLSEWVEICARPEVLLTDVAAGITPMTRKSQSMIFKVHGSEVTARAGINGCWKWQRFPGRSGPTMGFLVQGRAWAGGPRVIVAWGMSLIPTFVWCYRLAHDYRYLLNRTPFAMAELRPDASWKPGPISTVVAKNWHVSILGVED